MKRILCFTDSLGAGGAQRQLVGLSVLLLKNGYQVKVCYYQNIPFYKDFLDERGVPNELIAGATNRAKRIIAVAQYIKVEKPDWIIAYQETPSIIAAIVKKVIGGFRLITSERSTTQKEYLRDKIRFFVYRWADYIVPNSYTQGEYIGDNYPGLAKKVNVITNFVNLHDFKMRTDLRRNNVPIVIVVATLVPIKNATGLVEAVAILKDKGYKFHIYWYGKEKAYDDYIQRCQQLIDILSVNDYIELKEKSTAINEKYIAADFFCLPSFYEGTPNVICEAMSCGLPIACSDVCDNRRYVKEGENGALFNPKDSDNIAEALERLFLLSDDDYKENCRNSRAKAETLLSEDKFVQSYMKLIES